MLVPTHRRLPGIALAFFTGLILFAFVPIAGANSALDQYVEQVPGPGGDTYAQPRLTDQGRGSGEDGVGPSQHARDRGLDASVTGESPAVESGGEVPEPGGSRSAEPRGSGAHSADSAAGDPGSPRRTETLGSAERPHSAAAWSKATTVSGFNAPLAVFVALIGFGMVAVAAWRRFRGDSG